MQDTSKDSDQTARMLVPHTTLLSLLVQHTTLLEISCRGSNSYTTGCSPVRGDNPRTLARGLSYVQVDNHGITILYHLHQCRPCTSRDIFCAKVENGGISMFKELFHAKSTKISLVGPFVYI